MTRLAYRPVVSGDNAALPSILGGAPVSTPLHYHLCFRGRAFHPERPSLAICSLSFVTRPTNGAHRELAIVIGAASPRSTAAQMLAIADELDLKPATGASR